MSQYTDDYDNSSRALIEAGKGGRDKAGSLFSLRDELLKGFYMLPCSTVTEVSVEVFGWSREPYKNAPKRAPDLLKIGYISLVDNRLCRFTGKRCAIYEITEKGINYLANLKKADLKKAFAEKVPVNLNISNTKKINFSDLKSSF